MKEVHFAASVKRENILECEIIGISIEAFAAMALTAMTTIEHELL
ncbi:hypothetical protein SDC9_77012 [bioreactor metagenome]|uniref:Uncharacterized protein n=1 Tax=bioreactor metagenome TaxID=1076179 RepID=A0A644YPB0_9ZZZZ